MAKEQKAIAKLLDKDGITVDFWRFPIKNVDKIINQVLELVGKSRLGLSKDDLKNFDTFVIQTTEPDGTVIDTVFECSDVEFLDLVKEDYKDYFGYYPSENKYDSEKWSYILGGHKGYKESKKSVKKSLKESKLYTYMIGITPDYWTADDDKACKQYKVDCKGYYELGDEAGFILVGKLKDLENIMENYFGLEIVDNYLCEVDGFDWEDGEWITGGWDESKKSASKSLKEKSNDNGDVKFNDIYSCDLINVLTVTVYDKELYEKLREEDLVLFQKGVYEQIDWKMFQDEISYLRDDIYASDNFDVKFTLSNGVLIIDVLDNTDKDIIMEYKLEPKIVN